MAKFLIIVIALIVGQIVIECKSKPPINSNFFNRQWTRIGKRAGAKKDCGEDQLYKLDIFDKLSVSELNELIDCIREKLIETNAYVMDDEDKFPNFKAS
jgi:hypothetical protein